APHHVATAGGGDGPLRHGLVALVALGVGDHALVHDVGRHAGPPHRRGGASASPYGATVALTAIGDAVRARPGGAAALGRGARREGGTAVPGSLYGSTNGSPRAARASTNQTSSSRRPAVRSTSSTPSGPTSGRRSKLAGSPRDSSVAPDAASTW